MLPVLRLAAEGEKRVADVADRIADDFGLTLEEREELLPSGRQRLLHNRIHWAKFYMTKAGLIASPGRGRFVATDAGKALLGSSPERIDVKLLLQRPEFREFYKGNDADAGSIEDRASVSREDGDAKITPEEQIEAAYQAVQLALRAELLDRISQNSPAFFEQLIVDLLVGVVNEDRLGLDRVYVQAKRHAPENSVGEPAIREFVGSLVGFRATKGVFVTTSSFSRQARNYASSLPQRVILIDGKQLADLMIEHNVGVRISRALEFKRLDEDFFAEE
jgi:restriction system protein